jgi:hypothetical protein
MENYTVSQLIETLKQIEYNGGGDLPVVCYSSNNGSWSQAHLVTVNILTDDDDNEHGKAVSIISEI